MIDLNEMLGDGAVEAFQNAVNVENGETVIAYSEWVHEPEQITRLENGLVVTAALSDSAPWPGEGVWTLATVMWPDVHQQVFFQDGNIHWGAGLCSNNGGETGDALKRLASPAMKQFLATYIDVMKIQLPDVPNFYNRFLLAGFELEQQDDSQQVVITATLKDPNSRMAQLFNWRIAGADPEEEPVWRTAVREDMGLDKLFPND